MQHSLLQDGDEPFFHKKRKLSFGSGDNRENHQSQNIHSAISIDRRFINLYKKDNECIYQTENWQPSGSAIFSPLNEDIMVNTRNIEQFSCTRGNFSIAGPDGFYSQTVSGNVLHLWRYCSTSNRIFISRSFLFKHYQDFLEVQQALQRL